jgi:hypothetical protein
MPYTLNKTDQSVLVTLADGTKDDTKTSLTFIGKNFNNYGEAFNENFLKLLEHFASDVPPATPILGQLWYDKSARILKVYQGPVETWRVVPTSSTVTGTANQITATTNSTGVQLSLPQNIHNQATPTFRNLTLTENLVGAPPLTVTSTTLVNNLNADLLDGKHGSEYTNYNNLTNKPTLGTVSSLSTVTLGTNTTGNYVASITGENGVVVQNGSGAGSLPVVRHAATSTVAPVVASGLSGYQFVKNISFKYDTYGHTTETIITGGSESNSFKTLVPFNSLPGAGYTWVDELSEVDAANKRIVAGNPEDTLEVFGGGAIDVKVDSAKKAILIEHTDTSTVQSTNNLNGNVIRNITVDSYGHITALTAVDLDQRYLPKSGGTLTGGLTLNADPTTSLGAATKQYVDTKATTQYVDTKYAFTYGNTIYAAGYTNSYNWDNNYNYIDIYPPSGYTTLVAFIPSIAVIHFAGRVDGNDSIRCTWANYGTYIRVWVQNTEQRDVPAANWLAIWSA